MGNGWGGVQTNHVGLGKRQEREQQYLTCTKVAGLVSKKSCHCKMCFVQLHFSDTTFLGWRSQVCSGFVEHCRPDEKERQKTQHPFEAVAPLEEVQDLASSL